MITPEEAQQKIDELIKEKPALGRLHYKITCQLSHCNNYQDRQTLLASLMAQNLLELSKAWGNMGTVK